MFDWLFGGGWQEEPLIERRSRKRPRGPSWGVFWFWLSMALIAGMVIGIWIQEAQLHHAGLL